MVVQRKGLVFELEEPVDFIFGALEAVVYVFLDDCSGRTIVSSVSGNKVPGKGGTGVQVEETTRTSSAREK